nr:gamma-aminobutyric acid receptor alpha-like isoform X1 [Cherax quadricarinatus]
MGNFMITVYGPCVLLVVLSWVSFWLNREATADRISLGITTVLTMTFLGLEARTDLPKVPYSTALDLFVWLSYGFIFATIIEFAFVHVFTKVGSGEVYVSESSSEVDSEDEEEDEEEEEEEEKEEQEGDTEAAAVSLGVSQKEVGPSIAGPNGLSTSSRANTPPLKATKSFFSSLAGLCGRRTSTHKTNQTKDIKEARQAVHPQRKKDFDIPPRRWSQNQRNNRRNHTTSKILQINSVSNIDEASRILFPLSFLCINFLYWYTFLSHNPWPPDYL